MQQGHNKSSGSVVGNSETKGPQVLDLSLLSQISGGAGTSGPHGGWLTTTTADAAGPHGGWLTTAPSTAAAGPHGGW